MLVFVCVDGPSKFAHLIRHEIVDHVYFRELEFHQLRLCSVLVYYVWRSHRLIRHCPERKPSSDFDCILRGKQRFLGPPDFSKAEHIYTVRTEQDGALRQGRVRFPLDSNVHSSTIISIFCRLGLWNDFLASIWTFHIQLSKRKKVYLLIGSSFSDLFDNWRTPHSDFLSRCPCWDEYSWEAIFSNVRPYSYSSLQEDCFRHDGVKGRFRLGRLWAIFSLQRLIPGKAGACTGVGYCGHQISFSFFQLEEKISTVAPQRIRMIFSNFVASLVKLLTWE